MKKWIEVINRALIEDPTQILEIEEKLKANSYQIPPEDLEFDTYVLGKGF